MLARANGFGVLAPIVMSLTTYTGASQFAAVSILGDGGGLGTAIVAAILLASRYLPIGLTVAPVLTGSAPARFAQAQMVIDESWAVANTGDGQFARKTLIGAGVALYVSAGRDGDRRARWGFPGRPGGPGAGCGVPRAVSCAVGIAAEDAAGSGGGRGWRGDRAGAGAVHASGHSDYCGVVRLPGRMVEAMSDAWIAVLVVGAAAMVLKAAGPVAVGGRELPPRAVQLVGALAPALLAAFVVTGTFGGHREIVLDARALGLAAAAVCVAFRAPLLVGVVAAAVVTALARTI